MLNEREDLSKEYDQIEERTADNQRKISESNREKYKTQSDSDKAEADLAEYDEKFKAVCDVLMSLSMAENQAFTKEPEDELA